MTRRKNESAWTRTTSVSECLPDCVRVRSICTAATGTGCCPSACASKAGKLTVPPYGQYSLLGARSECLERHDSRAHASGVHEGEPTKRKRKYKYKSEEEANDAKRRRRNRARSDRRRRAHKCLMAAHVEAQTKLQQRGGANRWKHAMKRRYNRDLQRQKQRRKRHQDTNRQIWQRL